MTPLEPCVTQSHAPINVLWARANSDEEEDVISCVRQLWLNGHASTLEPWRAIFREDANLSNTGCLSNMQQHE